MPIPLARGLILILRLPLLVLIGVGALVVFAATRIDDWLFFAGIGVAP